MSPLKVAIIGAGPSGALLARLLSLHPSNLVSVTLYEGDASRTSRAQGGTLDLVKTTGQAALKAAALYPAFEKLARFDAQSFIVTDKMLKRYVDVGDPSKTFTINRDRPEIDRALLRDLLLDSLPEGMIQWGHSLKGVEVDEEAAGHVKLMFRNGITAEGFDLVVGADGAFSKVRSFVSSAKATYVGAAGITASIPDVEKRYPELHKIVRLGSTLGFGDKKLVMAQQLGNGALDVLEFRVRDEAWIEKQNARIVNGEAEEVRKEILEGYGEDWADELRQLIEVADAKTFVARGLYQLPPKHTWKHRSGVTLIGDAAHLMTPLGGQGVNIAMADSLHLSEAIIAAATEIKAENLVESIEARRKLLSEKVEEFERDMFPRARKMALYSEANMNDMLFTEGAPRSVIGSYVGRAVALRFDGWKRRWTDFVIRVTWWFRLWTF